MVRSGVVGHPSEWKWSGFHEIQNPKTRYSLIDHDLLKRFLNVKDQDELVKTHQGWIDSQLADMSPRQEHFSKSIAVGSKASVETICDVLKSKAIGRRVYELSVEGYQVRESISEYGCGGSEIVKTGNEPIIFSNSTPCECGHKK